MDYLVEQDLTLDGWERTGEDRILVSLAKPVSTEVLHVAYEFASPTELASQLEQLEQWKRHRSRLTFVDGPRSRVLLDEDALLRDALTA